MIEYNYQGISLYRNSHNTIVVIPDTHDERGFGRRLNKPLVLEQPYTISQVGATARQAFLYAKENPHIDSKDVVDVLGMITGQKSSSKRVKEWRMVNALAEPEEKLIKLDSWVAHNRSYAGHPDYPHYTLPYDCTDEELGKTIIAAFDAMEGVVDKW
jgi:hypothetical protein